MQPLEIHKSIDGSTLDAGNPAGFTPGSAISRPGDSVVLRSKDRDTRPVRDNRFSRDDRPKKEFSRDERPKKEEKSEGAEK